jgi:hypothetical protein
VFLVEFFQSLFEADGLEADFKATLFLPNLVEQGFLLSSPLLGLFVGVVCFRPLDDAAVLVFELNLNLKRCFKLLQCVLGEFGGIVETDCRQVREVLELQPKAAWLFPG